jgi:hypothetical protein
MRFFGIVATFGLALVMIAIPPSWFEIFVLQDSISSVEWLIILGLGLELVYVLVSLVHRLRRTDRGEFGLLNAALLVLGVVCLFGFVGEKVMLDEIARESGLGWGTTGEWIALYAGFTLQLIYNLGTLLRPVRAPVPSV